MHLPAVKILPALLLFGCTLTQADGEPRSFAIDYENDGFLLDGRPFRYVSGSFHYFRAPRSLWGDRLRKIRAAGLNAVSTYVEWSTHEPEPEEWRWDGEADLEEFLRLAQQEDLLVILRPGPYICAERDFGGFPYWLLKLVPDIKLRTRDQRYLYYAERYLNETLRRVGKFLRGNGGPVIMVQMENEYGSFYACDSVYMSKLKKIFDSQIGNDAVLFTTDGTYDRMLKCGTTPGVFKTVDFGVTNNVLGNFANLRRYQPKGPLVNSEFYPGWLTHWDEPYSKVNASEIAKTLDDLLAYNVSVNFYMFFGGTNFGFTSGANINDNTFSPQLTSYDYNAPITESGDLTDKYFAIRNVIAKYHYIPDIKVRNATKRNYGAIKLTPILGLFDEESRRIFGSQVRVAHVPPTFESLGLSHYLVLYESTIPKYLESSKIVVRAKAKDRALVYLDNRLVGILSRTYNISQLEVPYKGRNIQILTETQGRVNYGNTDVEDFKGIFDCKVNGDEILPWKVTGFKLNSVNSVQLWNISTGNQYKIGLLEKGPQFFVGNFYIDDEPQDTFLNTQGWGKGVAYLNGYNLGRYWPMIGPQITLYVPANFLKLGNNVVILLEFEYAPNNNSVILQKTPILDYYK